MHDEGQRGGTSRRSFLTTSAALAGAAALGTGVAAAKAGAPRVTAKMPKKQGKNPTRDEAIRIGVIGTGGMGTGHCHAFTSFREQNRANVDLVAVADVNDLHAGRAREHCASSQGIEVTQYRDYRELLKRDDIHGVLIASPEHWHAQHAIDAMVSGKDVYVEKPMTLRLSQAMDLRKAVLDHPERIFQVGTQQMMLPKFRNARKAIKDGKIGKAVWSQTSYCRNSPDGEWNYYRIDPAWEPGKNLDWDGWLGYLGPREWDPKMYIRWRRYRDFSTGIIGDLLVHVMTPLIYSLDAGWPTRVIASGGHYVDKDMENHDQVNLTIEFEEGHTMIVAGSTTNEVGLETLIRGNEANIYLNGRHCLIRPERAYADIASEEEIQSPDIGNDQDQLRLNWLECMRSREPAESNIDLASKVMVAVDLATRSMWDGHAYTFDPDTHKVTQL